MRTAKKYVVLGILFTAIAAIFLYSIAFYWGCLWAKRSACRENVGALIAFQEGSLDRVEEDEYGEVYAGYGYRVWTRDGRVSQIRDDNKGYIKTYQDGILQAIHMDNPLEEAISLCTFFSVDPVVTFEIRSEEEIRRIQEGIAEQGMSYLEDGGYFVLENGGTYVAVD